MIFIQRDTLTAVGQNQVNAAFPSSLYTQVFPCSRRRSVGINEGSVQNQRSFPFDPEARLNTERNNRRGIGVNGYTDSFVSKIDIVHVSSTKQGANSTLFYPSGSAEFTIAGYSFTLSFDANLIRPVSNDIAQIQLTDVSTNPQLMGPDFLGKAIAAQNLNDAGATKIYANIIIEAVNLYDGSIHGMNYDSWVLRHQIGSGSASTNTAIDVLRTTQHTATDVINKETTSDYFFSGLSFTASPLTGNTEAKAASEYLLTSGNTKQLVVSLCILNKQNDTWVINQEALLPSIRHGERENSLEVGYLNAIELTQNNIPVASIQLEKCACDKYRLRFKTTADTSYGTYTCSDCTAPSAE